LDFLDRWGGLALKKVPITRSITGLNYSFLEWEDSKNFEVPDNIEGLPYEERERFKQLKQRAATEGKITGEQWRAAKNGSNRAFYEEIFELLNESSQEFEKLNRVVGERFQGQKPGMMSLKQALEGIGSIVKKIVEEKRELEPDPVTAVTAAAEPKVEETQADTVYTGSGPIRSRQEAVRLLAEVTAYFRRTEPHSPVSYLLQRAIHWCGLPLEKWLEEVVKDGGVLAQLRETLGIKADAGAR
jgi:type VI secretion system protein ImpA